MGNIKTWTLCIILVILIILVFAIVFKKPVDDIDDGTINVELKLLTVFNYISEVPISECPVYWTYINASKYGYDYGSIFLEPNVKDYLDSYEYSNDALIISWGRPLHSLSYTRSETYQWRSLNMVIGKPIFGAENTPRTLYVYQVQNVPKANLISEYDATLSYHEHEIEIVKE